MIGGIGNFLPLLLLAVHSYGQEKATGPQKMQHFNFDQEPGYSKAFLNGILNIKSAMLVRDKSCFTRDSNRSLNTDRAVCKAKSKNNNETAKSSSCWPTSLLFSGGIETHDQEESETERQLRGILEEFPKNTKANRKVQSPVNDNIAAIQGEGQNENHNENQNVNQHPKTEGILNALKAHLSGTFNALTNVTGAVNDNNESSPKSRKKKSKKHTRKLSSAKYIPRKMSRKHRKNKQKLNQKKVHSRREDFMDRSCVASPIEKDTCQKP